MIRPPLSPGTAPRCLDPRRRARSPPFLEVAGDFATGRLPAESAVELVGPAARSVLALPLALWGAGSGLLSWFSGSLKSGVDWFAAGPILADRSGLPFESEHGAAMACRAGLVAELTIAMAYAIPARLEAMGVLLPIYAARFWFPCWYALLVTASGVRRPRARSRCESQRAMHHGTRLPDAGHLACFVRNLHEFVRRRASGARLRTREAAAESYPAGAAGGEAVASTAAQTVARAAASGAESEAAWGAAAWASARASVP